jgi:hypothetical protein
MYLAEEDNNYEDDAGNLDWEPASNLNLKP